ncbi:MAG TPA: cupin domain-containing protein [Steroidobacteraceae bacterium]|nr:cupin domain-containing protein [Steroidobacteraceae bacterium]
MPADIRRIVTSHDADGNAIIASAAPPSRVVDLSAHGPRFYEIWNTRETPARIDRNAAEPHEEQLTLAPPRQGTRIRVLDIPPDSRELNDLDAAQARRHFELIGAAEASTRHEGGPHPFMHRTETIDYGIILSGEIYLIVDAGEMLCREGDIIIQRGTNHAWANRSNRICRIAFILIDGVFDPSLREVL